MAMRRDAVLAAMLCALLALGMAGGCARHAHADGGYRVDPRDRTNWESAERMRHASERARAAEVASALACLREARAAAEAAEAAEAAVVADAPADVAEAARQGGSWGPRAGYGGAQGQGGGFRSAGVLYGEDGTRFTWYSQRVLPGGGLTELNANGRHVSEEGYVVDADGYIALASGSHAVGEVIETPVGTGRVYDSCPTPGTVDVYTDW